VEELVEVRKEGDVIIQTYNPEHYSIKYAALNDFEDFYKEEIGIRYNMNYPPFSKICVLT
jgi:primosomal protein N' (replication factor Y)